MAELDAVAATEAIDETTAKGSCSACVSATCRRRLASAELEETG